MERWKVIGLVQNTVGMATMPESDVIASIKEAKSQREQMSPAPKKEAGAQGYR